ncbi:MAG: GNAT family N-acetyltransferase, partial [Caldisericota bacterium]|nr:GNAT family N-acetyltransferase [Caldisericota bacterium]
MRNEIIMRRALLGDVEDFISLIILSAPLFFKKLYGNRFKSILQYLFSQQYNLFSFRHVYFAESGGKRAGMILEYDWRSKKQEDLRTGLLLLKYMELNFIKRLPLFLKARDVTGWVNREEHYISNVAVYPEYRGMGIGTDLITKIEIEARRNGAKKIALD